MACSATQLRDGSGPLADTLLRSPCFGGSARGNVPQLGLVAPATVAFSHFAILIRRRLGHSTIATRSDNRPHNTEAVVRRKMRREAVTRLLLSFDGPFPLLSSAPTPRLSPPPASDQGRYHCSVPRPQPRPDDQLHGPGLACWRRCDEGARRTGVRLSGNVRAQQTISRKAESGTTGIYLPTRPLIFTTRLCI